MKKWTIFFVTALSFIAAHAEPVGRQKAFQEAVTFIQGINPTIHFSENHVHKISGKSANTVQPYYVFNADGNKGFVIVSGDDRTEPILGYAEEGSFDTDNIPEGLQFLLDCFAQETQMEDTDDAANTNSAKKVVALPRRSITPFNPRRWYQTGPYNNLCPIDGDKRCSTGCLATAVAITIGCFNWPAQTTAIPAYTTSTRGFKMSELPPLTIDWDHILDRYDGTYTMEEANAVAQLMQYVAQGIKSDFTKDAVNAYIASVPVGIFIVLPSNTSSMFGRSLYTFSQVLNSTATPAPTIPAIKEYILSILSLMPLRMLLTISQALGVGNAKSSLLDSKAIK